MVWPFSRRREEPAAQAPPPAPVRPSGEWARLPALEPVGLRAEPTITDVTSFEAGLATRWAPPPVLGQLGHEVSMEAPAGLASNILAPVEGYPNAPELTWSEAAELPELPVVGAVPAPLPSAPPSPPAPTPLPDAAPQPQPQPAPQLAPPAAERAVEPPPAEQLVAEPEPQLPESPAAAAVEPAAPNPVRPLGRVGPPLSIATTSPAVLSALASEPPSAADAAPIGEPAPDDPEPAPDGPEPAPDDEPGLALPGIPASLTVRAEATLPDVVVPSSFTAAVSSVLPDLGGERSPDADEPAPRSLLGPPPMEVDTDAAGEAPGEAPSRTRPLVSARPPLLEVAGEAIALLPGLSPAQEPAAASGVGPGAAATPAQGDDSGFGPVPDLLAGFTMPGQSDGGGFASAAASLPDVGLIASGFSSSFDTSAFSSYPPPSGRSSPSPDGDAAASGGFDLGGLASGGFSAGVGGSASGGFDVGGAASGAMSAGGFDLGAVASGGSPLGGLFGSRSPSGDSDAGEDSEDSSSSGFPMSLGEAPVALPSWVSDAMAQAGAGPLVFGGSESAGFGPEPPDDDGGGGGDDAAPSSGPDLGSWSFSERPPPANPPVRRRMGRIGMPQEAETAEGEREPDEAPAAQLEDQAGSMFGQLTTSLDLGASAAMSFASPAAHLFGGHDDAPAAPDPAPAAEAPAAPDDADDDDDQDDEPEQDDNSGEHMEILAGKLYDKLRDRLRRELLVDRERSLTLTDWR